MNGFDLTNEALLALLRDGTSGQVASLDSVINRWLANLSPTARRSYRRNLNSFAKWALRSKPDGVEAARLLCSLTSRQARTLLCAWIVSLSESGLSVGTVICGASAMGSLLSACRDAGLVEWSLGPISPKPEKPRGSKGPDRGDIERLFATIDDEAAAGDRKAVRDAALLRLLYTAALRRSEAAGLRMEDVDLRPDGTSSIVVRRMMQTDRIKTILTDGCAKAIARWMAVRGDAPGFLFFGEKGGDPSRPIAGESIRRVLARWARKAGIRGPVRPQGLRRSAATWMATHGSLDGLHKLGGWANIQSAVASVDDLDPIVKPELTRVMEI